MEDETELNVAGAGMCLCAKCSPQLESVLFGVFGAASLVLAVEMVPKSSLPCSKTGDFSKGDSYGTI